MAALGTRSAAALATALALLAGAPALGQVQVPTDFVSEVVRSGFNEPSAFAFLPDGRALVAEQRTGRIRMVVNGQIATTDPIFTVPAVLANGGERGLLGIAVDPDWPVYPFFYAFYNRVGGMRIVRWLASEDVDDPNGQRITFSAQRILIDSIPDAAGNHNGGTLRFGPDRCLYASLGDDAAHCAAGDSTTLRGQILRLSVDRLPIYGGPAVSRALITPPDNPFVNSPDSNARLVFAFGLRNPFRFHIDPITGSLFVADVGDADFEELSEVSAGDFLGWPWREGNLSRFRQECQEPLAYGSKPYRAPIAVVDHENNVGYAIISAGPYRPVFGGSANWPPEYYPLRGDVFFSQYYEGWLRRLTWDGFNWVPAAPVAGQPNATDWATGLVNTSDYSVGPDGSLWWLSQFDEFFSANTGTLSRIRYVGSPTSVDGAATRAQALRVSPNPSRGPAGFAFALAADANIRLDLYDLAGRKVRTLHEGMTPAGETRLHWDGTDDQGQKVGTGVFFARLTRDGEPPQTARVLRLR